MSAKSFADSVDLHRQFADEYVAPRSPAIVRVRPAKYLAVRGRGVPGSPGFQTRLQALYSVAYTVKFLEKAHGRDFRVLMLEGLFELPKPRARGAAPVPMAWTLLVRVPSFVRPSTVRTAARTLRARGKSREVDSVHLVRLEEGRTVQLLHIGPYAAEEASVRAMEEFAAAHDLKLAGPHHEIYLSDPRRVPERRLRTILRYPATVTA